jgi:hypothetical protein
MDIKIEDLHSVDLTLAPPTYYLETAFISLQILSLATTVSLPLLLGLPENIRIYIIYAIFFLFLSSNAHSTFQQKNIRNSNYRFSIQSICLVLMFLLNAYIYVKY